MQVISSVGDGAVSEAGKGVLCVGKLICGYCRYMFCATAAKQTKVRRGQRTKHVSDVLPSKIMSFSHSNGYRAINSMNWGVAFVAARADVYVMMSSLTDDQIRQSPYFIDEANVQSVLEHISSKIIKYHLQPPETRHFCSWVKCRHRI